MSCDHGIIINGCYIRLFSVSYKRRWKWDYRHYSLLRSFPKHLDNFNFLHHTSKTNNFVTMMKIAVFLALVAVATAAPGLVAAGVLPASTGPLTYAAPLAYAHAPIAYAAAPVAVHAAPVAIPAPVAYASGVKVTHTVEPVEQHGYQIAY